ncbi:hypothetical protein PACILC2_48750 [Paenibacillus cisolokensis]|uniref:Uncharacterized protein n=1 Tax=Paenibacillus cisolokensis TaxID=1658519 RepID=A0ABQ4NDM5_9BACL|nr:hypothetical protein PACILC2_48750 [Paenibacillus cisolokensis]
MYSTANVAKSEKIKSKMDKSKKTALGLPPNAAICDTVIHEGKHRYLSFESAYENVAESAIKGAQQHDRHR